MNHHLITKHALHVLTNSDVENDKAREIAVAALVAATELDLAPPRTAAALWSYLRGNPRGSHASEAADVIGSNLLFDSVVHSQAIEVVGSPASDRRLYESCLTILIGSSYAGHVSPKTLLGVSECCTRMGRRVILMVPQLAEAIHEQGGGLPEEIIRAVRDNWSRSSIEDQRFEAPEIARLLPKMDLAWLGMMFKDPSAQVRRAVAMTIPRMAEPEKALQLIEERAFDERHHEVLAALHGAIEDIIRQIEREALRRR